MKGAQAEDGGAGERCQGGQADSTPAVSGIPDCGCPCPQAGTSFTVPPGQGELGVRGPSPLILRRMGAERCR